MKLRATDGNLLPLIILTCDLNYIVKTGGSRPTPYFCPATKVCKNAFLLAEGISFARFLRDPITTELNKPARYRGSFFQCGLLGKILKAMTTIATLRKRRGSQEPRVLRGKCSHLVDQNSLN